MVLCITRGVTFPYLVGKSLTRRKPNHKDGAQIEKSLLIFSKTNLDVFKMDRPIHFGS